jgi:hypothetical protein
VEPRHVLTDADGPPSDVAAAVRESWTGGTLRYETRTH